MDTWDEKTEAWVGDAVLALFAREWILAQPGIPPAERSDWFVHLTNNQFLSAFGEPTAVEGKIGRIYRRDGLEAAFAYLRTEILPLFEKQRKRLRTPGRAKAASKSAVRRG